MQWEFRKILETIQSYKLGSGKFLAEIEKGTLGASNKIVREIQLILSDANAMILSKVLAMRFAKDIMILGRQDVINELAKLVPHMLKVGSYRMQSDDPNRGESFFSDQPQYLNASPLEKQEIERYGSTYFTLILESIYHWAKWVPADQHGNESIFSKGLNTLLDRGVKFNNNYSYYKNSDTEKFKNTYRVEFFSEESGDFETSSLSSSRVDSQKNSQNSFQSKDLETVERILNSLYVIEASGAKRFDKLEKLNENAVNLLEKKYSPNGNYSGKEKSDKKWLQNLIVNYNLLSGHRISYEQFMKRAVTQTVQLSQKVEFEADSDNGFKKVKSSAKRQHLKKGQEDKNTYEQLMKKQQQEHLDQRDRLKYEIGDLNQRIQNQKYDFQNEKGKIIQDYEDRIWAMKKEIAGNSSVKNEPLLKQNEKLRQKLLDLEKSLQVSRSKQVKVGHVNQAYDLLKIQNSHLKRNEKQESALINLQNAQTGERIRLLQKELQNERKLKEEYEQLLKKQTGKNSKQVQVLSDELNIYKNSLKGEREDFDRKYKQLQRKLSQCELQNRNLKQKFKVLQKKLDIREIETVELNEQVKLLSIMGKDNLQHAKSRVGQQYMSKTGNVGVSQKQNSMRTQKSFMNYDFKKYQKLRRQVFHSQKQRYLRFCRCCLKKKDLLLKQDQLQIGIISEPLSNNEVRFIIHLTNTSDTQLNEIRIWCQTKPSNDLQGTVETQYIFCLMPNQQEKINIFCRSLCSFISNSYDPIFIGISYVKNAKVKQTRVALPFVLFKIVELYKPNSDQPINKSNELSLTFSYSKKMIPQPKCLFSYFPPMVETSSNKFECDLLHRETGVLLRLILELKQQNLLGVSVRPLKFNFDRPSQLQSLQNDFLGLMEFCFRR